jgi:hypothetical protein
VVLGGLKYYFTILALTLNGKRFMVAER